jgi:hypothetical protein
VALLPLDPKSTSAYLLMNAIRSFAMPCLACPSAGSGCSNYSWQTRRRPMPRFRISSICPSAASVLPAGGAWLSCASSCRAHETSVATSTHRVSGAPDSWEGVPGSRSAGPAQTGVLHQLGVRQVDRGDHRNVSSRHLQTSPRTALAVSRPVLRRSYARGKRSRAIGLREVTRLKVAVAHHHHPGAVSAACLVWLR